MRADREESDSLEVGLVAGDDRLAIRGLRRRSDEKVGQPRGPSGGQESGLATGGEVGRMAIPRDDLEARQEGEKVLLEDPSTRDVPLPFQ